MPISHPYSLPTTFRPVPMSTELKTYQNLHNFPPIIIITSHFSPKSKPYLNPNPNFKRFEFSSISQSRINFAPLNSRVFDPVSNFDSIGSNVVRFLRSILPGGTWWNFLDGEIDIDRKRGKSISVVYALWRIWGLIGDDGKWVVFVAFASLIVAAMSEISMPNLLAACIFSAQNGDKLVFYNKSRLLILLCLTSGVSSGLRGFYFGVANLLLVKHLKENLYSVILFQDMNFFDSEAVGNLTSRLSSDCQRLSRVIGHELHLIFRNVLQGTGALINLLMLSPSLALSSVAICCVLVAIFFRYGPYLKEASKVTQELEAYANEVACEAFSSVKTIRVHGAEKKEVFRYKNCLENIAYVNKRESVASGLWNMSFSILYRSTQVLAVLFGGMSIFSGHLSPEQITKYILYCEWLIYATWRLVDNCSSLLQSLGASERVFHLIDLLPSNEFSSKGLKLQLLHSDIEFVNVSFCYPTRGQTFALKQVNISIRANEVVAMVGPSGSGKSTLVKLLLRFFSTTEGEILVDGHPLKDLDIRWLREEIGYVPQEPRLFHMDVKSNITYGCCRSTVWEDVECAAKLAHAHDFIQSLPQGYDTLVDDDLLSGGQKQRICIARALLRNPSILILDEPTSALDAENERYITEVLHKLRSDGKTRTIILITHRLSSVKTADKIFVMDSGKIVETGRHVELLQMDGHYARLARMQEQDLPFC